MDAAADISSERFSSGCASLWRPSPSRTCAMMRRLFARSVEAEPPAFFKNRPRPLQRLLRFLVPALLAIRRGQIVEVLADGAVPFSKALLANRNRAQDLPPRQTVPLRARRKLRPGLRSRRRYRHVLGRPGSFQRSPALG